MSRKKSSRYGNRGERKEHKEGEDMTITEMFEYAQANGIEDYDVMIPVIEGWGQCMQVESMTWNDDVAEVYLEP